METKLIKKYDVSGLISAILVLLLLGITVIEESTKRFISSQI